MKTRTKIISAVLVLLVGTGAVAAGGWGGHHDRGWGHHRGVSAEHMIERLGKHLDLSEEQETSLTEIVERNRETFKANLQQGENMRNAVMTIDPLAADYDQRANELADQASSLVREQAMLVADIYKEVATVLTPAQREELRDMTSKMMERMQHRREKHKGHS